MTAGRKGEMKNDKDDGTKEVEREVKNS